MVWKVGISGKKSWISWWKWGNELFFQGKYRNTSLMIGSSTKQEKSVEQQENTTENLELYIYLYIDFNPPFTILNMAHLPLPKRSKRSRNAIRAPALPVRRSPSTFPQRSSCLRFTGTGSWCRSPCSNACATREFSVFLREPTYIKETFGRN